VARIAMFDELQTGIERSETLSRLQRAFLLGLIDALRGPTGALFSALKSEPPASFADGLELRLIVVC
jgi:hypothetical protein